MPAQLALQPHHATAGRSTRCMAVDIVAHRVAVNTANLLDPTTVAAVAYQGLMKAQGLKSPYHCLTVPAPAAAAPAHPGQSLR